MIPKNFWLVFFLLVVAAIGCTQNAPPQPNAGTAVVSLEYLDADGGTIFEKSFTVSKGTNAFEAMQQNVETESEAFSFGVMVKTINGIAPPEGYYLALFVNGQYAEKGIKDYEINEDTLLEWKTEKIEGAPVGG